MLRIGSEAEMLRGDLYGDLLYGDLLVGGTEHSRRMFDAPYAADVIDAMVEFACRRG